MPVRSLIAAVEAFTSRMLQAWAAGWSVPTDEVFVSARLPQRDVDATGCVTDRWLLKAARSAAVKWRAEVCGVHRGLVRSVVIAGAGLPQPMRSGMGGAVHVTARYCGRIPDGGFCFRHGIRDAGGSEILHFVSQIYFNPPPDLPAYPAINFDVDDDSSNSYQVIMRSAMPDAAITGGESALNSAEPLMDSCLHSATSSLS